VSRDVADEALTSGLVKHLLPQRARRVEVLRADFRQECNSLASELAVDLVEVEGALAERNRVNGRKVVGACALVEEGHLSIALEVCHFVGDARLVDGELLVVYADAVAVRVGVAEKTAPVKVLTLIYLL
jgi:hypothetical protein